MQKRRCITIRIFAAVLFATIIFACFKPGDVMAQREGSEVDLRKAGGKLVSEGQNKTPVGPRKLLSYKLEEVDLPKPKEITANGRKRSVTTVLRLSINAEQHQPNSVIWIDDVLFPSPWEPDGSSIATLIYDPSLLRDGATISVGSGDLVYDLPEPLKLPARFTTNDEVENGNRIALRTLLRVNGNKYVRSIMVHAFINQPLPAINNRYSLQIGRKFFSRLIGNDKQYSVEMSTEEFNELKPGARVNITVGPIVIAYLGRLDKKMLDR
jgi:hypothetical protein